jgi:putative FmdB family regulatory protein
MPRYTYRCEQCETVIESVHSMKECLTECEKCEGEATLVRVPVSTFVKLQDVVTLRSPIKVGTLVEEHIREAREELSKDKILLRTKDYEEKK